jgi:5,10-methylene-tetrahydrofolate dehydrogenase/methenyl tetrahydrofolate cyclohydrolase
MLVGNDPASEVYVRSKDRKALELGIESFQHILRRTPLRNICWSLWRS